MANIYGYNIVEEFVDAEVLIMWVAILLILLALGMTGCEEIQYIPVGSGNGTSGSVCPADTVCFDVSTQPNPFTYNVSTSLDNPYTFDARG